MKKRTHPIKISRLISLIVGIMFIGVAVAIVTLVNYSMRQQALVKAEAKMRLILDRNMAIHTYFSQELKPELFEWTEPILTDEYFNASWMSSSYAVREMGDYFEEFSSDVYYYKDAVINARNPENEADAEERAFLIELNSNPSLNERSAVHNIDGKPYLIVMRPGEVLEESCLRCHGNPADAPGDLVRIYGSERSFNREAELGSVISIVSIHIPLEAAYAGANRVSLQLSIFLLVLLGLLFTAQDWLPKRLVFTPLAKLRDMTLLISTEDQHLGEQMPEPFGEELGVLTRDFNAMSKKLRENMDNLELRIQDRTEELTRSQAALELSNEQLRNLTIYWQDALENERTQVSHEIHDKFSQSMSAIKMDIAWLAERMPDGDKKQERLEEMNQMVDASVESMRQLTSDLRAGVLDELGLKVALEGLAQEFTQKSNVPCHLDLPENDLGIDPALSTTLFRIFQKVLLNISHYAQATLVKASLKLENQSVVLNVQDNGRGISQEEINDPHSLGLLGLRERAIHWGGEANIHGEPGIGTIVTVRIPLTDIDKAGDKS